MASVGEPFRRDPFAADHRPFNSSLPKSIPILPSASVTGVGDPMDTSQSQPPSMGPPTSSPNGDRPQEQQQSGQQENQQQTSNGGTHQPVGAAAAAQQPKVVQTAFIHKLYKYVCVSMDSDPAAADKPTAC